MGARRRRLPLGRDRHSDHGNANDPMAVYLLRTLGRWTLLTCEQEVLLERRLEATGHGRAGDGVTVCNRGGRR